MSIAAGKHKPLKKSFINHTPLQYSCGTKRTYHQKSTKDSESARTEWLKVLASTDKDNLLGVYTNTIMNSLRREWESRSTNKHTNIVN